MEMPDGVHHLANGPADLAAPPEVVDADAERHLRWGERERDEMITTPPEVVDADAERRRR